MTSTPVGRGTPRPVDRVTDASTVIDDADRTWTLDEDCRLTDVVIRTVASLADAPILG